MNESIWNFNDHILLNFEFGMLACEMRMASDDISTFNGDKEWHSEFDGVGSFKDSLALLVVLG